MIKVRVGWCTLVCGENVITLGKLIGLLILFCHTLLSIILFFLTPKIRGMTSLGNHFSSIMRTLLYLSGWMTQLRLVHNYNT